MTAALGGAGLASTAWLRALPLGGAGSGLCEEDWLLDELSSFFELRRLWLPETEDRDRFRSRSSRLPLVGGALLPILNGDEVTALLCSPCEVHTDLWHAITTWFVVSLRPV